jgi:hypothetical protein
MLHQDESLQTQVIARETKSLIDLIKKESFRSMPPIQIGDFDDISSWVEDAVKLKQALMVSSKEYTIQFCSSGVDFDHSWMRAEDENGRHLSESECIFAKVKLCLFPAIAQYSTPVLAQGCDISAVLASRKPFFKKREPNTVEIISKAVVLVENEISQSGADFSGIPMEY